MLWNVGSVGVLGVSGILINVVIAKSRGAEALGVFNQVYAIYIFLSQIATGGVQLSALKHVSYSQSNRPLCAQITTTALILAALFSVVVCSPAYLARGWIGGLLESDGVGAGLTYAIPGLFFFSLNKVLLNVLNAMRFMRAFAIFQSFRVILILTWIVVILVADRPSSHLALSLTLTEGCLFLALIVYINVALFVLRLGAGCGKWFAEHVSFGLRGFFGGVLSEANTRVDVIMLGYFSSDALVGVYSFAAIIAEGFSQIPVVIRRNVDPILGIRFAAGEKEEITRFASNLKRVFFPLFALISLLAIGLYPIGLALAVGGEAFGSSWAVFSILMVGIAINAGYRPFKGILLLGGFPGLQTIFTLSLVVTNIALNALMIPILGMQGAAIATALVYVLEAVLIFVLARKIFSIRV